MGQSNIKIKEQRYIPVGRIDGSTEGTEGRTDGSTD
jgi:hypothetical protein